MLGNDSECSSQSKADQLELKRVNDQIAIYHKKISNEKEHLDSLNRQIAENEAKLLTPQQPSRENAASMKIKITSLENRLNQSLVAFNTKVKANKDLRRKIDELRTERVLYDQIYTKLEYQVQENADEMKQILEQMKKRITMRDKALDEVGTLRQQLLEATEALRKDKEEFDMLQIQFNEEDDERDQDQLSMQQDQHQQEATIHQSIEANLKQQQFQDEYDDDKMMDEAFAKVKQLTGIDNEDQLIVKLNQMEDLNFNRFHLTQELVAESDIMDSALQQASRELEMLQVSNFVDAEKSKEADMTLEKSELEIRIKDVELRYQEKSKEFEQIKGSIQTACSQLDVPLPCHLIATNEITINNVMEYLAAIEKQAIDVIGTMRDFEDSEAESADPVKKSTDYVLLPNIEDIAKNGTKDEEDRPLTLQELQSSLKSHEAEGWVKKN